MSRINGTYGPTLVIELVTSTQYHHVLHSQFSILLHMATFSYTFYIKFSLCNFFFKQATFSNKCSLSIRKFTDNSCCFLSPHYCRLIITDEIMDIGCFNRQHVQIYFHISDVLSRSENITDCVYKSFV